MYRYHTLPGARAKTAHFGFKGALVEVASISVLDCVELIYSISADHT